MSITKAEKETVILFDEADDRAEVYTHNTKLKNRLARAANKHPQTYVLKYQNSDGGVSYAFPKKYLTVMFREPISDTDRERCQGELPQRKAVAIPTRKFNAGARIRRGQDNSSAEGKAAVKP